MSEAFTFKTERPWPNRRLKIAAIVGHTTPTACRLWFRAGKPGAYRVLYFEREKQAASEWFAQHKVRTDLHENLIEEAGAAGVAVKDAGQVGWDSDTTFVVALDALQEAAVYQYALYSVDEARIVLGQDKDYSFRTPSSEKDDFSFGLYSCHMPFKVNKRFKHTEVLNMDVWEYLYATLARHRDTRKNLDFVIAGGDQVYTDGVSTLNIWQHLNRVMRKEKGKLLPDVETMVSWYRDIYRGYWGFDVVRRVFSAFPTYMIWDDHELGDGCGSYFRAADGKDELNEILGEFEAKGLSREEGWKLVDRMKEAAIQVYQEYEHSHNPATGEGQYDYSFTHKQCAEFYVLDGRGYRDINRASYKILGREQMDRFRQHVDGLNAEQTRFLFVVSAVPVQHMSSSLVNMAGGILMDKLNLDDDLRDAWEWEGHKQERKELMEILFGAAKKGIRVCILSGDVHVSAVFSLSDSENNKIYQLTSSAITYNLSKAQAFILSGGVPDEGETEEGYHFERLALRTEPSYALIKVRPQEDMAIFQLYGEQSVGLLDKLADKYGVSLDDREQPLSHSIAKIKLTW